MTRYVRLRPSRVSRHQNAACSGEPARRMTRQRWRHQARQPKRKIRRRPHGPTTTRFGPCAHCCRHALHRPSAHPPTVRQPLPSQFRFGSAVRTAAMVCCLRIPPSAPYRAEQYLVRDGSPPQQPMPPQARAGPQRCANQTFQLRPSRSINSSDLLGPQLPA